MSAEFEGTPVDYGALVRELLSQPSEEYTLPRVIEVAVQTVPGCEFGGISIRRGHGVIQTPAWVGEQVPALDGAQYELDEGPCLDAIRLQETVIIDDTRSDPRWPRWGPQAAELGALSVLSVRLSTSEDVVGGLNLYSSCRRLSMRMRCRSPTGTRCMPAPRWRSLNRWRACGLRWPRGIRSAWRRGC